MTGFMSFAKVRADWLVLSEEFCILASCFLSQVRRNSVFEQLTVEVNQRAI